MQTTTAPEPLTDNAHPSKFAARVARGMSLEEISRFYSRSRYDGATLAEACAKYADELLLCEPNITVHNRLMDVVAELV